MLWSSLWTSQSLLVVKYWSLFQNRFHHLVTQRLIDQSLAIARLWKHKIIPVVTCTSTSYLKLIATVRFWQDLMRWAEVFSSWDCRKYNPLIHTSFIVGKLDKHRSYDRQIFWLFLHFIQNRSYEISDRNSGTLVTAEVSEFRVHLNQHWTQTLNGAMVDTFLSIAMKKHISISSAQLLPMVPLLFPN